MNDANDERRSPLGSTGNPTLFCVLVTSDAISYDVKIIALPNRHRAVDAARYFLKMKRLQTQNKYEAINKK